jgi:protein SCO1/2
MRLSNITTLFVLFLIAVIASTPAHSQVVQDSVTELQGIDVIDHLGDDLPLDLHFVNEDGQPVKLGDYFNQGKPVIVMLGYYECPMLCNLVFNGLSEAVKQLGWVPGKKFQIVTVSIDSKETPELAKAKKANYIKSIGMPGADAGWAFLTGTQDQIDSLAKAIGFKFYYVEDRDEYAHPAVLTVTTETGELSRYLFGIAYPKKDLKLALLDAADGKIGTVLDKIVLYCYHYDPESGSYTVFAYNVMKIAGIAMVLVLGTFVGALWRRERHKHHNDETPSGIDAKSSHPTQSK